MKYETILIWNDLHDMDLMQRGRTGETTLPPRTSHEMASSSYVIRPVKWAFNTKLLESNRLIPLGRNLMDESNNMGRLKKYTSIGLEPLLWGTETWSPTKTK